MQLHSFSIPLKLPYINLENEREKHKVWKIKDRTYLLMK